MERRAYICHHKDCNPPYRVFVSAGEPVPHCPAGHGKMKLQVAIKRTGKRPARYT